MWFKVDDKLHDHRKARKAGKAECQRVTGLNPHRFLRDQQEAS